MARHPSRQHGDASPQPGRASHLTSGSPDINICLHHVAAAEVHKLLDPLLSPLLSLSSPHPGAQAPVSRPPSTCASCVGHSSPPPYGPRPPGSVFLAEADSPTSSVQTGQKNSFTTTSLTLAMETAHSQHHTYGPSCRLAPVAEPRMDAPLLAGIPPINAQFFYHSLVPIDDPLSVATTTATTAADGRPTKGVLRPFSHADNNALEAAWLSLADDDYRKTHDASLKNQRPGPDLAANNARKLDAIVDHLIRTHREKHSQDTRPPSLEPPLESLASTDLSVCCQELLIDASNRLREVFCEVSRDSQPSLSQKSVVAKVMSVMEDARPSHAAATAVPIATPTMPASSPRTDTFVSPALSTSARGRASSFASNPAAGRSASIGSGARPAPFGTPPQLEKPAFRLRPAHPQVTDGISGRPFVRVGDPDGEVTSEPGQLHDSRPDAPKDNALRDQHPRTIETKSDAVPIPSDGIGAPELEPRVVEVPVGLSRLHEVSLPVLQMKPIYWSPVNDIAIVSRSTWFYRYVTFC